MAVFIGNSVKAEHWFLEAPGTKTKSTLRQGVVFFRLCPGKVSYFCFSFSEVSRVKLAIIWLCPCQLVRSKEY